MLTVKSVLSEVAEELAYECYNDGLVVGRLVARLVSNRFLEVGLSQINHSEAARTLVANLEREAKPQGIKGIYLRVSSVREGQQFEAAGYKPLDDLKLCKNF